MANVEVWKLDAAGQVWTRPGATDIPAAGAGGGGGGGLPTRGAAALGSSLYAVPAGNRAFVATTGSDSNPGTLASPCATVNHARTLVTAGGTVVMRAGTYHESFQTSSAGTDPAFTIQNYPGETVWFDGSTVITTWTSLGGGVWQHNGVPTQFLRSGGHGWQSAASAVFTTDVYADLSDQVFVDGTPLQQVADGATPAAGQFSVSYSSNWIKIGQDPTGHEIRVSDLAYFFVTSSGISVKGCGIRRYSPDWTNFVRGMMFFGGTSAGSIVENCLLERSASDTIFTAVHNITINQCTIQNNTFCGLAGNTCDGTVITNNVFTNNNTGLFTATPQCADMKLARAVGMTIDNNECGDAHNANGIWLDVTVVEFQITNNYVHGSHQKAIHVEESDGGFISSVQHMGVIAGNIVDGSSWGILVFCSGNMYIWNNLIRNVSTLYVLVQQDRGFNTGNLYLTQTQCPWNCVNVNIANNILGPGNPIAKVRYYDSVNARSADTMNGKFHHNEIRTDSGSASPIQWGNTSLNFTDYSTLALAQSAHPSNVYSNQSTNAMSSASTDPMPVEVATALGVATGTQHLGPYITG